MPFPPSGPHIRTKARIQSGIRRLYPGRRYVCHPLWYSGIGLRQSQVIRYFHPDTRSDVYKRQLVDQGDYQEAVDLYKEIYNYKDSAELQKIANFKKAQKFFDQENYSECLFTLKKMFNSLKDIDGATELYNECKNRLWRQ